MTRTAMRIRVHSDMHEEFRRKYGELELPHLDVDVTVLAGDIGNGLDIVEVARRDCFAGSVKLLVPGNHEYYDGCVSTLRAQLAQEVARHDDIVLLDDATTVIRGVRFVGATLWTSFDLLGVAGRQIARDIAERMMPDYRIIEAEPGRKLTVDDTVAMHAASRRVIEAVLAEPHDGPTVVVSHHAPHPMSVAERFEGSPVNPAFVSDLSPLLERCDLWIHGHTHDSFDYRAGRARVVANPSGYRKWVGEGDARMVIFENPVFDPARVVEL
jgi:Icc-related predicted phosphoesterase